MPNRIRGAGVRGFLALPTLLAMAACGPPEPPPPLSISLDEVLPPELLEAANPGREVLGPDGRFRVPGGIDRVWIDVGAHDLETTRHALSRFDDVLLIGIEPLEERWRGWPEHPHLIALPVAIAEERGWLDFHVAASDESSSLLESVPGNLYEEHLTTVEVRKVPVLRLADVLERVPPGVDVEYVKSDVQGLDLQVLRSAGEALERVTFVKAEVIEAELYRGEGDMAPATRAQFTEYMDQMGFRVRPTSGSQAERGWLDVVFVNRALDGPADRARRWLRGLFSVAPTDPV